jgi:hypothetical protein
MSPASKWWRTHHATRQVSARFCLEVHITDLLPWRAHSSRCRPRTEVRARPETRPKARAILRPGAGLSPRPSLDGALRPTNLILETTRPGSLPASRESFGACAR